MPSTKNHHPSDFRNVQFSKLVKTDGRLREFNFRKSNPDEKGAITLFFVDVTDDRSNRILFRMEKNEEAWKIQPQLLPDWIVKNENQLHQVIEEEMKIIS
jgi:hypothetical protein